MRHARSLVGLTIAGIIFLGVSESKSFALERLLLRINGADESQENSLEDTTVSIIEDATGGLKSIRIVSEKATVSEIYTLDQLNQMRNAPIRYKGFKVLAIDGQYLRPQGGELKLTYYYNVLNPFSDTGSIDLEIDKRPPSQAWTAVLNDAQGRRTIQWIHLLLHSVGGLPVGVEDYSSE